MGTTLTPINRREFLYYAWGVSIALFTAETVGALIWAVLPRYEAASDCFYCFEAKVSELPQPDNNPILITYDKRPRFWIANIGENTAKDSRRPAGGVGNPGLIALYPVCTHLGCLFKWHPSLQIFVCPCHGSAFLLDGTRVHGPASRDLDRFIIKAIDSNGEALPITRIGNATTDPEAGQPLAIPPTADNIRIDDGVRIHGKQRNSPNTIP
jgi:cytochrome b6-f complex iron-sulfur subunit